MNSQFKAVIEVFTGLKRKFQSGEISRQEFVDEMKKLRLKDEQGRFWMIGAQSGKWYYFDGKDWIQAEPPSYKEKKAICIYCGFENDLEADTCARCGGNLGEERNVCPKCGAQLKKPYLVCPNCGPETKELEGVEIIDLNRGGKAKPAFILRSVHPFSIFLLLGVLGLCAGIVLGALAGAAESFKDWNFLPSALSGLHGGLQGGILFGLLGGGLGFVLCGVLGLFLAIFFNFFLSLIGGIKFAVLKTKPKEAKEKKKAEKEEKKKYFGLSLKD
jgi:ribosomal protein L40E